MKTALVTGGSGDIGSAICKKLAKAGYAVAVGYNKNKQSAEKVCEEIKEHGGIAISVSCKMNKALLKQTFDEVKEKLSYPEVLVNNAGTAHIGLFSDMSDDSIIKMIQTNLTGAVLLTKYCIPEMVKRHYGKIVNISSVWGEVGASCEVVYSATKSGLIGFTKALGKELAPSGINVNCISAGMIDTKMNSELNNDEIDEIVNDIPASRMGTPEDIANAVYFLCSDSADYINGQVLRIDGGWI